MRFYLYKDIFSFHRDTYEILMRHEAQNVIILGNLIIGNAGTDKTGWRDPANWFMAAVSDDSGVLLTGLMTPPYNLTLHFTNNQFDDKALTCFIRGTEEAGILIPGLTAEKSLAERFAESYASAKEVKYSVSKNLRLYELLKVDSGISITGSLRLAKERDMAFLPYWIEAFNSDCFGHPPSVQSDPEHYRYEINTGKFYVLENNGIPVTITKITRELQSLCCIGYVYTPPYFRRNGYATSCVAALSKSCLKNGFSRCVLYTDLSNPVSNSIYQKIGYRQICDSSDIKFD